MSCWHLAPGSTAWHQAPGHRARHRCPASPHKLNEDVHRRDQARDDQQDAHRLGHGPVRLGALSGSRRRATPMMPRAIPTRSERVGISPRTASPGTVAAGSSASMRAKVECWRRATARLVGDVGDHGGAESKRRPPRPGKEGAFGGNGGADAQRYGTATVDSMAVGAVRPATETCGARTGGFGRPPPDPASCWLHARD
jgi:hypothetical protein